MIGLYHVAALQKEGLKVWDAHKKQVITSRPFIALGTADAPGLTHLSGLVGHQGACGCRLFCRTKGRHKPDDSHYYPALLKPAGNYRVAGSDHSDIDVRFLGGTDSSDYHEKLKFLLASPNETQYKIRKTATGIVRPSLFAGLNPDYNIAPPLCFPIDLMHLVSLNLTNILVSLFRGTLKCETPDTKSSWDFAVLQGETWKKHGALVAKATPYLPGSFDRAPRNPAEKINSGYKAWEFLLYIFGLAPALLYNVLGDKYWQHFCQLVYAICILHQRVITREQLVEIHKLLCLWHLDFEQLYYQRKTERLQFCQQSIHALVHLAPEVLCLGPPAYYTQWTLERTIGNLGEEIKQPSNPYINLSQRGLIRAQTNALIAMSPTLAQPSHLPRGSEIIGSGYTLLRARDRRPVSIAAEDKEMQALSVWYQKHGSGELAPENVSRWARLLLPTGQIARCAWKEKAKPLEKVRMACNVKVCPSGLVVDVQS